VHFYRTLSDVHFIGKVLLRTSAFADSKAQHCKFRCDSKISYLVAGKYKLKLSIRIRHRIIKDCDFEQLSAP
jgi:hypothetical protein